MLQENKDPKLLPVLKETNDSIPILQTAVVTSIGVFLTFFSLFIT
jgi:hypothetical protein